MFKRGCTALDNTWAEYGFIDLFTSDSPGLAVIISHLLIYELACQRSFSTAPDSETLVRPDDCTFARGDRRESNYRQSIPPYQHQFSTTCPPPRRQTIERSFSLICCSLFVADVTSRQLSIPQVDEDSRYDGRQNSSIFHQTSANHRRGSRDTSSRILQVVWSRS